MGTHKMTDMELQELDRRNQAPFVELKETVRELKRVVTGFNGDTGLKGHAERTDIMLEELKQGQAEIKVLLTGDDTKLDDDGGIKGKLREREKREKVIIRLFWIVIGVFFSGSGGLIFFAIQSNLTTP